MCMIISKVQLWGIIWRLSTVLALSSHEPFNVLVKVNFCFLLLYL